MSDLMVYDEYRIGADVHVYGNIEASSASIGADARVHGRIRASSATINDSNLYGKVLGSDNSGNVIDSGIQFASPQTINEQESVTVTVTYTNEDVVQ